MQAITRVYDTYAHAKQVVTELERTGIPSSDISLVANKYVSEQYEDVGDMSGTATGASVGAAIGGGAGLLAGLGLLAIPGLGPVVAAGWLSSMLAGAVAGAAAGGLIGALTDAGVSESDAHVYAESVRRGGTMVTARTPDNAASTAHAIMDRFTPVDPARRGEEYRQGGWTKFDPDAPAYRPSQAEIERMRRS